MRPMVKLVSDEGDDIFLAGTNVPAQYYLPVDAIINFEDGNSLWWPFEYVYNKRKVIVHHTVNDMTKIKTENDMKALLQSVYKYHAFSNGWGDI